MVAEIGVEALHAAAGKTDVVDLKLLRGHIPANDQRKKENARHEEKTGSIQLLRLFRMSRVLYLTAPNISNRNVELIDFGLKLHPGHNLQ